MGCPRGSQICGIGHQVAFAKALNENAYTCEGPGISNGGISFVILDCGCLDYLTLEEWEHEIDFWSSEVVPDVIHACAAICREK